MNNDEEFITGIVAAPKDDSPRLAYASWLAQKRDGRDTYLRNEMSWVRSRDAVLETHLREMASKAENWDDQVTPSDHLARSRTDAKLSVFKGLRRRSEMLR